MTEIDTIDGLVGKLAAVPIADDAVMTNMLRQTLVRHADNGTDVAEPALLGLLAVVGALEARLAQPESSSTLETTP